MQNNKEVVSGAVDELPPLPTPAHRGPDGTGSYFDSYTADQMREYALAARAALQPAQTAPITDANLRDEEEKGYVRGLRDAALLASQPTAAVSDEQIADIARKYAVQACTHACSVEFAVESGIREAFALLSHPAAPAQPHWKGLTDSQWLNIVNLNRAWESHSKADAVELAVKLTEARLKVNNAALSAPAAQQPKLTLALPDYETRRIVIASDELIDDERLVCVAIQPAQQPSLPRGYTAEDYRNAPSGIGPLACEWKNKPHRLAYDLCSALAQQHLDFQAEIGKAHSLLEMSLANLQMYQEQPSETASHNAAIEAAAKVCEGHTFGSPVAAHAIRSLLRPAVQEATCGNSLISPYGEQPQPTGDLGKRVLDAAQEAEKPRFSQRHFAGLLEGIAERNTDLTEHERGHLMDAAAYILGPREAAREQPAKGEK